MRVAVHIPEGHPHHGGGVEGPAVVAFRLGRIEEGVHNAPLGHPEVPIEQFVGQLLEDAKAEYPDCEIVLERLVDNGDGTSRWVAAEHFDVEQHTPVGAGESKQTEVSVSSEQQAG